MNEIELRAAMRAATSVTPPEMSSAEAVSTGRRAARRRTIVTSAAAAAAVAGVMVAAVQVGVPFGSGNGSGDRVGAGAPPAPTVNAPLQSTPSGDSTKPVWPTDGNGQPQQDATARSGPRYEKGKALLDAVLAVVPGGWSKPDGDTADGLPLRYHQAQISTTTGAGPWEYEAYAAVGKGGKTGRLLAEVHTTGNSLPTEPCALARSFWGMQGTCEVRTVDGKKVGVVVKPTGDDRFDQWAAYRYPDGTVVFVAQSRNASTVGATPSSLGQLPFSATQLAALTLSKSFHLE